MGGLAKGLEGMRRLRGSRHGGFRMRRTGKAATLWKDRRLPVSILRWLSVRRRSAFR
jgi:hypothetical protein